jgi:hypothetical protein
MNRIDEALRAKVARWDAPWTHYARLHIELHRLQGTAPTSAARSYATGFAATALACVLIPFVVTAIRAFFPW